MYAIKVFEVIYTNGQRFRVVTENKKQEERILLATSLDRLEGRVKVSCVLNAIHKVKDFERLIKRE